MEPTNSIHLGQLAAGGLIAGLVFVVGGIAGAALIDLPARFAEFGVEPSAGAAVKHTLLRFGLGTAAVWLFALTGSRDRSVMVMVAVAVWFCAYVPGSVVLNELGALPAGALLFSIMWGLAETICAVAAGASYYRRAVRSPGAESASAYDR